MLCLERWADVALAGDDHKSPQQLCACRTPWKAALQSWPSAAERQIRTLCHRSHQHPRQQPDPQACLQCLLSEHAPHQHPVPAASLKLPMLHARRLPKQRQRRRRSKPKQQQQRQLTSELLQQRLRRRQSWWKKRSRHSMLPSAPSSAALARRLVRSSASR